MRFSRSGFAVLCLAMMSFTPARVEAGSTGASELAFTPLQLTEYNPLKVKNKGPTEAEGIVYFIDGLDSYNRTRDDFHVTYPYVYGLNTHHGWDVISAKFPNAQNYSFNAIPSTSRYVMDRLAGLRAQGYKKVVLAGQSWGAWVTVDVARRDEARAIVDAILLTAPANYGTREFNGKPNRYFERNKSEYVDNIRYIRIPTLATFFRDDEFDPGGRGPITRDTLKRNGTAALVIDRPADFRGHGAGWLPEFDYVYGACINDFLTRPRDMQCGNTAPPSISDIRSVTTEDAALAGGGKLIALKDIDKRTYIVTRPEGYVTIERYDSMVAKILSDTSSYTTPLQDKDGQICAENACGKFYQLKDGSVIGFGSDGNWTAKMVAAD